MKQNPGKCARGKSMNLYTLRKPYLTEGSIIPRPPKTKFQISMYSLKGNSPSLKTFIWMLLNNSCVNASISNLLGCYPGGLWAVKCHLPTERNECKVPWRAALKTVAFVTVINDIIMITVIIANDTLEGSTVLQQHYWLVFKGTTRLFCFCNSPTPLPFRKLLS